MMLKRSAIGVVLAVISIAALSAQLQEAPVIWRQALGGRILASPHAQAQSVVVITDDRSVRAYSPDGRLLWRYQAKEKLSPCLTRSPEGTSYFGTADGLLVAVNRSGRELWRRAMGNPPTAILIGWDGRLFAVTANALWCFSASGLRKWRIDLPARLSCAPVLSAEGGPVLALDNNSILSISPFGEIESIRLPQPATALTVADDQLVIGDIAGSLYHVDSLGVLTDWLSLAASPASLSGGPAGLAYFLTSGEIGLIDRAAGQNRWRAVLPATTKASIINDERGWFFLSDNAAAAFDDSGRRLWNARLGGTADLPSFSDDGILYAGGKDWILYAYRIEERVKADAAAFYAKFPDDTYGLADGGGESSLATAFGIDETLVISRFAEIETAVESRSIGASEAWFLAWLMDLAGSSLSPVPSRRSGLQAIADYYRARSVALIGLIGSRDHIPFLTRIFRADPDFSVRAAAAAAIGTIGVDPNGLALTAFSEAVNPPGREHDERVLLSVVAATSALCRFSGPPLSDEGIPLLIGLAADTRPASVRTSAQAAIARFMERP